MVQQASDRIDAMLKQYGKPYGFFERFTRRVRWNLTESAFVQVYTMRNFMQVSILILLLCYNQMLTL